MNDTAPDEPFIRHSVPPANQLDAQAIAAMTDDEFDEYMADLFENVSDEDEPEVSIEERLRQSEEDIAAGRVRPFRMVFAEIAEEFGFDLPGLAKYRTPVTET